MVGGWVWDLARGGRKNKTRKRRTSAPARKKKYVRTFFLFFYIFLVRFWGFLGKGSSKTREKKLSTFPKKSPGEKIFGGEKNFWVISLQLLFLSIFLLRWLSASR
jgi:hypothetical protein